MRKQLSLFAAAALLMLVFSSAAFADAVNPRPYNPGAGNLDTLQAAFDGIGATSIDVYTDQANAAFYQPTGAGHSTAAYVATITWGYAGTFGIYDAHDNAIEALLFDQATMTPGTRVGILFSAAGVKTYDADTLDIIDEVAGFSNTFGFYFDSSVAGEKWYSEDSRNVYGQDEDLVQALIYESKGDLVTIPTVGTFDDSDHWYVAFEGRRNNGDYSFGSSSIDFNDIIVQMESITPIPEPSTMLLFGSGLLGLGILARKKFRG